MNTPVHIKKFKQEMERQFFSKRTVENYGSCATSFLVYFDELEHPLHVTDEQFSDYLYENFDDQNTQRANHSAVKKFYEICFNKDRFRYLPYAKKKHTRPIILSEEEMQNLLRATTNLKHFTITLILYATGVRIDELLSIQLQDIDEPNLVIHIMKGKGGKQRQVTMKKKLLEVINVYKEKYKPVEYLFENDSSHKKYSASSVNLFLKSNAKKAGITKKIHAHLIRHCYCSHALEHGENLYTIQQTAGHSDPKITANTYIHGSSKIIANAYSPIDSLPINIKELSVSENKVCSTLHNPLPQTLIETNDTKTDKSYQILFNRKTYILKEKNNKICDAPEGAKWSIGVLSEKAITWFKNKGAVINEIQVINHC